MLRDLCFWERWKGSSRTEHSIQFASIITIIVSNMLYMNILYTYTYNIYLYGLNRTTYTYIPKNRKLEFSKMHILATILYIIYLFRKLHSTTAHFVDRVKRVVFLLFLYNFEAEYLHHYKICRNLHNEENILHLSLARNTK